MSQEMGSDHRVTLRAGCPIPGDIQGMSGVIQAGELGWVTFDDSVIPWSIWDIDVRGQHCFGHTWRIPPYSKVGMAHSVNPAGGVTRVHITLSLPSHTFPVPKPLPPSPGQSAPAPTFSSLTSGSALIWFCLIFHPSMPLEMSFLLFPHYCSLVSLQLEGWISPGR